MGALATLVPLLGLVRPPRRREAGFRLYTAADVARLQQVLSLRALGLGLKEIRDCLLRPDLAPLRTVRVTKALSAR